MAPVGYTVKDNFRWNQIMRRGNSAKIIFDKRGEIFAISTGSDCVSEHEWGSKPMMDHLCQVTAGGAAKHPSFFERKTLSQNLADVIFSQGTEEGEPVGVFGFATEYAGRTIVIDHRELRLRDKEVVGAWDASSFALKVKGKRLVDKLQRFAEKVQAGDGIFAGSFLKDDNKEALNGVILAVKGSLRPEHRTAIATAQAKWEADQVSKTIPT